ncbi:MAG: cytochrome d ubiquinol oxidase subunit II [Candidatus Odinarchaeota archaeon]
MTALQVAMFSILFVAMIAYAILDGFDLGVGFWYIFARDREKSKERVALIKSIGPVWDGNEVWLLATGGVLFAAFPHAYATLMSSFYLPIILVLVGLVLRAVSIEFRNKLSTPSWRKLWDAGFIIGSLLPAIIFGLALGNLMWGLAIGEEMNFSGSLIDLFNPYAILVSLAAFVLFVTHGGFYIVMKIEGEFARRVKKWLPLLLELYAALFVTVILATALFKPERMDTFIRYPLLHAIPLAIPVIVAAAFIFNKKDEAVKAFACSAASTALMAVSLGITIFPNIIPAIDPANSLTIENSSSSETSLFLLVIIALVGTVLVLIYTVVVYYIFRGKISVEEIDSSVY